jgi:hypothetical protein
MTADQPMVELPHARLAGGPRTLLVLEGLTLENKAPTGRALWLLRWAYKRYLRDYTVYQVARRRGLPAGATTRDMAADHGQLVGGLVLSDTGCRLGEEAKALLRAARDKATSGRAAEAQADVLRTWTLGGWVDGWCGCSASA